MELSLRDQSGLKMAHLTEGIDYDIIEITPTEILNIEEAC